MFHRSPASFHANFFIFSKVICEKTFVKFYENFQNRKNSKFRKKQKFFKSWKKVFLMTFLISLSQFHSDLGFRLSKSIKKWIFYGTWCFLLLIKLIFQLLRWQKSSKFFVQGFHINGDHHDSATQHTQPYCQLVNFLERRNFAIFQVFSQFFCECYLYNLIF